MYSISRLQFSSLLTNIKAQIIGFARCSRCGTFCGEESQWPQQWTIKPARGWKAFAWQRKQRGAVQCSSKFQLMTLTQNALVLHTTHQPAKPVEQTTLYISLLPKQAPQQEQPFECGSCKKQGECENKVYLVLVIQNNMSVHLQVDSELGCKIFWHIEIS